MVKVKGNVIKANLLKWMVGVSIVFYSSDLYGMDSLEPSAGIKSTSSDSHYNGSQAFNQFLSSIESVNPQTGSLGITKSLINQVGISEGVTLNLNLVYSLGSPGILGLPPNWIFDLNYVIPGASLTYQGRTYVIDNKWADQTNYQSGLRYINDHGIKFDIIDGIYKYCLTTADGSRDYFDATGKLIKHKDRFGNNITYDYVYPQKGIESNYFSHITDSYGQLIYFAYPKNSVEISLPNGAKTTLRYSSKGVETIRDDLGNQTTFGYYSGNITSINYPTGLKTYIDYKKGGIPYYLNSGEESAFPAVSDLRHVASNNSILEWVKYVYGGEIRGYTFTGYSNNYHLSNTSDGLMDSKNSKYQYEVLIARMDAFGQSYLAKTRTYYNYLHLPIVSKQYLDASDENWYQTNYTYNIDLNFHARTTNYDKPINTLSSLYMGGKQIASLNKSSAEYDNYGNLLSSQQDIYDLNSKEFVPQSQKLYTFQEVTWGKVKREMPKSAISQDLITGYQRQTNYALTQDTKNISSKAIQYQNKGDQGWNPWKTKNYTYDDQGRPTSITLQWSSGTIFDPDSISSTTSKIKYGYHSKSLLTVTHTDALGYDTAMTYNVQIPGAPLVQVIAPLGQKVSYEYDLLGRLIKTTDAKGYVYKTEYTLAASSDMGNSVIATNSLRYKKATYFDELGRPVKSMDNGDPTNPQNQDLARVLNTTVYNSIGQVNRTTDMLGLSTTFQYDFLGRLIKTEDPLENVSTTTYGDIHFSTSSKLNGELVSEVIKDGYGRSILKKSYPDSSDSTIPYFICQSTQYNGFGQAIQTTKSKVVGQAITPLTQTNTLLYDADGKAVSQQVIGYNASQAQEQVQTTKVYDLSGQSLSTTKKVTYADGRTYQVTSDKTKYDQRGDTISVTNAAGQVEKNTFDANGRLQTHTRYDETVLSYKYDDNDNLTTITWVEDGISRSVSHTYYNDNSPQNISDGQATINYAYYLDGSLASVTYPHPHGTQKYTRDKYSRISSQGRPSGVQTTYTHNEKGFLTKVQQENEGLIYTYGKVNHKEGIVTSMQLFGRKEWTYRYQYTGWGPLASTEVLDSGGTQILKTTRTYDELRRITTSTKSSQTSLDNHMNLNKTHTYDGLNQLISSQTVYANGTSSLQETYTYDGNNNVLTRTATGLQTQQNYQYNTINQLTTPGIVYDTNGRMTKDDQGYSYAYNQQDELIKVMSLTGEILASYTYYPDGMLQSRSDNTQSQEFFYDGKTVNAVSSSTKGSNDQIWTSFLFNGQERIGAYEQNEQPLYYIAAHGSTGVTVSGDTAKGLDYQPYGSLQTDNQHLPAHKSFTWNQEYVDPASDLVYLRSRFYNPRLMRFMSYDTTPLYNRYAFGNGDPINMIDPTGQWSFGSIFGTVFSGLEAVGGIALTMASGGLLAEGVGGALIGAGINGISYSVTHQDNFNWGDWGIEEGVGAAIGAASVGLGAALPSMGAGLSVAYETASNAGFGASGSYLGNGFSNLLHGQNFNNNAASAAEWGAISGVAAGFLSGAVGRGVTIKSRMALSEESVSHLHIYEQSKPIKFAPRAGGWGHIKIGIESAIEEEVTSDLMLVSVGQPAQRRLFPGPPPNRFDNVQRIRLKEANVQAALSLEKKLFGRNTDDIIPKDGLRGNHGPYNHLVNDCTTYGKRILSNAGMNAPLWACTPKLLTFWLKQVPRRFI